MNVFYEIYQDMIEANNKADKASFEYNRRDEEITELETNRSKNINLSKQDFNKRLNDLKDKDQELTGCFNRQKFWSGEVQRHSSFLVGSLAYIQLKNHIPNQ